MSYFSYSMGTSTNPLLSAKPTTTNLVVGDRVQVDDQYHTYHGRHGCVVQVVTLACGEVCYDVQIDDGPYQLLIARQLHLFPQSGHGQEVL